MHVVLATQHLADVGGSETYLHTVADNLVRLGHRVTVHAQLLGAMAEQLRAVGAEVVTEDGLPDSCDALTPASPPRIRADPTRGKMVVPRLLNACAKVRRL